MSGTNDLKKKDTDFLERYKKLKLKIQQIRELNPHDYTLNKRINQCSIISTFSEILNRAT